MRRRHGGDLHAGTPYLALRPLLPDWVLAMPRGAQVIYPKDSAQILTMGDVFPGAKVLEAGAGCGALSCALLRAVGETGQVHSFELREDFAEIARRNVEAYFGGPHPAWRLRVGDVAESPSAASTGSSSTCSPRGSCCPVAGVLVPGGVFVGYVATTPQLSELVEALRAHGGFTEPRAWETLVRDWHVDGLAVRPDHRMVAHTAFLVSARRLAPGVTAPPRRRKPSKGAAAYAARKAQLAGEDSTGRRGLESVRVARTWMHSPGHSRAASTTSKPQVLGHVDAGARVGQQLAVGILDVRQAVDVELEHLRRVLHAQPVAGAQILVHPDPQRP